MAIITSVITSVAVEVSLLFWSWPSLSGTMISNSLPSWSFFVSGSGMWNPWISVQNNNSQCNSYLAFAKGGPSLKMQSVVYFCGVKMVKIGWICSRHLFETSWERLTQSTAHCHRQREQNVFCLSCVVIVTFNCIVSHTVRTYTPDAGLHGKLFWSGFWLRWFSLLCTHWGQVYWHNANLVPNWSMTGYYWVLFWAHLLCAHRSIKSETISQSYVLGSIVTRLASCQYTWPQYHRGVRIISTKTAPEKLTMVSHDQRVQSYDNNATKAMKTHKNTFCSFRWWQWAVLHKSLPKMSREGHMNRSSQSPSQHPL